MRPGKDGGAIDGTSYEVYYKIFKNIAGLGQWNFPFSRSGPRFYRASYLFACGALGAGGFGRGLGKTISESCLSMPLSTWHSLSLAVKLWVAQYQTCCRATSQHFQTLACVISPIFIWAVDAEWLPHPYMSSRMCDIRISGTIAGMPRSARPLPRPRPTARGCGCPRSWPHWRQVYVPAPAQAQRADRRALACGQAPAARCPAYKKTYKRSSSSCAARL